MAATYVFNNGGKILRIALCSQKVVHITYSTHDDPELLTVTELTSEPDTVSVPEYHETATEHCICTESMRICVDKKTLGTRYEDICGKVISGGHCGSFEKYGIYRHKGGNIETRMTVDGVRSSAVGGGMEFVRESYHTNIIVDFDGDESLFGLGSHEEGYASLKGQFVPLYQENMRIAIPVFVSTKGYAYMFNCASLMTFDATDGEHGIIYFDSVDAIDYYFIVGNGYDDVCRGLRSLTGVTPLLPRWATGYIQSRERYMTGDELVQTAREHCKRNIPLDCIVQDWMYWNGDMWGDKHFDALRYPDPKGTVDALHDMNVRLMISIWPNMSGDSPDKKEFEEAGLLLSDGSVYNAFSAEGRELYVKQAFDSLFSYGIDGWWCDASEPYDAVWCGQTRPPLVERMERSAGVFKKYIDDSLINAYSLMHARGMYDEQRRRSDKRVVNLTRSGFIGQHRYGTVVWSGDVSATWETLRRQVCIAQNYIACGEAYWNSDIGAFFVKPGNEWFRRGDYIDGCGDLAYRELYTRWMQFAGFTPFMRSHGTDTPREIWQFGEAGTMFYDAIADAIRLRYRLLPYFYSVHAAGTLCGEMPIRPLALEFPNDRESHLHTNEYMYGHEMLVCPVTRPMYYEIGGMEIENPDRKLEIYLPPCGWYDFYEEKYYDGGQTITVDCRINRIPVFVRAGALIPTSEVMMSTADLLHAPYEVRIYSGADGNFTLYEDAGDGYGYENGEYAITRFVYDNASGGITETVEGMKEFKHKIRYRVIGK